MKSSAFLYLILPVFFFGSFVFAHAEGWQFTRQLWRGARGPDVFALQKLLNENQNTRVAETGAGSPGNETNYFGPATARAVTAFQQQNAIVGEVGRVGPMTLVVLNKNIPRPSGTPFKETSPIRLKGESPPSKGDSVQSPLPARRSAGGEGSTPTQVGGRDVSGKTGGEAEKNNPNARNLDQFLDMVKQVGGAQGYASEKLETLTKEISSFALGTTTDFFAQFAKEANENTRPVSVGPSLWSDIAGFLKKIAGAFFSRADAQALSFGGMVVYVFPCTCSGNWLVGMIPMSVPPIVLITHYQGAQTFTNFNAPFTLFMLGHYIPQGAPCLFYAAFACVPLPSQAQTTPFLGSS